MSNGRISTAATCGQCRHWHEQPANALNLTGPRQGECREQLHAAPVQQPGGVGFLCYYPSVPEGWAACGRFELRVLREVA